MTTTVASFSASRTLIAVYRVLVIVAAIAGVSILYATGQQSYIFVYFTVQSNIFVVIAYGILLSRGRNWDTKWTTVMRGFVALCIGMTGLVDHLVLRTFFATPNTSGPIWTVGDILCHTVVPIAVVLDWLILGSGQRSLSWSWVWKWLVYPIAYTIFAFAHGLIWGDYIYPFFDLGKQGGLTTTLWCLALFAVFEVLAAAIIGLGKLAAHLRGADTGASSSASAPLRTAH